MCKKLIHKIDEESSIYFYGSEINNRHDFFIRTNCRLSNIQKLIFLDSRGISKGFEGSLIERIINKIDNKINYLIVGRPIEITTWMTFYNFIRLNNISPEIIITNMGFVDFTPKKKTIIEESLNQASYFFCSRVSEYYTVEEYKSKDGSVVDLYMQNYEVDFSIALSKLLKNTKTIILNTPSLINDFKCERERPISFFKGIQISNDFNRNLNINSNVLEFFDFSNSETYDGVHFTNKGNKIIFKELEQYL